MLEGGEVGVGLGDGFWIGLGLGVLSQSAVDAGQTRVLALALAGGDDQIGLDGFHLSDRQSNGPP